ncbi:endolytic transglycosylase MltG [Streptomyces sp. NPDC052040]|uniref:endolytic transglycosylase MltG n=1 Tax=unclassified Streptomyces TaxID=2593676 RepID=UPI0037CE521D
MQKSTPPRKQAGLTRRSRVALIGTAVTVAATALAVPLVAPDSDGKAPYAGLVVPEGWRTSQVYAAVDKALGLPPGTTRKSLPRARLRLPRDARGNPEGYLFPASYPVHKGTTTPESLLRYMVETANRRFGGSTITAGAQRHALTGYQAVTIASIVQAEAATESDMAKVARVVFNRLERGMPLQMDSTLNYALKRRTLTTSVRDTQIDSPYNSYRSMGLPPTPISNPGEDAMRATLNPAPGNWLYFVTVKPGDTRFTGSYEEQQRNVAEFNRLRAAR